METKFEERFVMLSMTSQQPQAYTPTPPQYPTNPHPMQTAYFTTPPPPFIPPPATIHVPSPQQPPPYQQQYNAGKKRRKGQGTRIQGWSQKQDQFPKHPKTTDSTNSHPRYHIPTTQIPYLQVKDTCFAIRNTNSTKSPCGNTGRKKAPKSF